MTVEYLPVEGCEKCEFFETEIKWSLRACPECILYGEAKKVEDNAECNTLS